MNSRPLVVLLGVVLSVTLFTSPSSAQRIFTDTNSVWKYLSDGTSLDGVAWQALNFPDAAWANGVGRMGFGGDGERTVIGAAANGYTNFYFRHVFNVAGATGIANLFAYFQRDDGLILYLNGTEILRINMPPGPVESATQATAAISEGNETALLTNSVNPALLVEGPNIIAAEVHQIHGTANFSSDLGFYLMLVGAIPGQRPTVAVANPGNGTVVQGDYLTLNATASDPDGTITQVEFFAGPTSVGVDGTAPYGLVRNAVPPDNYAITAVATDNLTLRATSAPVRIKVVAPLPSLVPFGATWRYLDDGSNQGFVWTIPEFNHGSWKTGVAELGFGDSDEATIVSRTGTTGNPTITTYFRHSFPITNPQSITNLVLRLVRDDGAIVYLNGAEILRDNLTNNFVDYLSLAALSVEDEPIIVTNINPALLVMGTNTIAVEIHQQNATSSDLSLDLQLLHNVGPNAPAIEITAPIDNPDAPLPSTFDITAMCYDLDGVIVRVQFFVDDTQIGTADTTAPYSRIASGIGPGQHLVRAVATDNNGFTGTSFVTVSVAPSSVLFPLISSNSQWRYLDDGSDPGTAWRGLSFIDTGWRTGRAELGFGDNDEQTLLRRTNEVTGLVNITFYFRRELDIVNPGIYSNLVLQLRRDDGAIVYINGVEAFRSNMTNAPGVPVQASDFAGNSTGSETAYNITNLSPALLVQGRNVVAVEVHQQSLTSTDVSFELQLFGERRSGPMLRMVREGDNIVLSWFPAASGVVLQQALVPSGPWSTYVNQANPQTVTPVEGALYFRLCSGCL